MLSHTHPKQMATAAAPLDELGGHLGEDGGLHAHPPPHEARAHTAHARADLVQHRVVPVELEVARHRIAVDADDEAARVVGWSEQQLHGPAVQHGCAECVGRDGLEVVVPHVRPTRRVKVLILADGAGARIGGDLPPEVDKRRDAERLGEVQLVEHALDLREEAMIVVVAAHEQHADGAGRAGWCDRREQLRRTQQHRKRSLPPRLVVGVIPARRLLEPPTNTITVCDREVGQV